VRNSEPTASDELEREDEVAEQVKKQLSDMRNSLAPEHERAGQGSYEVEDTGHETGQRTKESTGELAGQAQGTVGQDADQTRATDAGPWATFHQGSIFDRQGEYDLAAEAYQQAVDSGHPEVAFEGMRNLQGLLMRFPEKYPFTPPTERGRRSQ